VVLKIVYLVDAHLNVHGRYAFTQLAGEGLQSRRNPQRRPMTTDLRLAAAILCRPNTRLTADLRYRQQA
jgi:hypothetical protein